MPRPSIARPPPMSVSWPTNDSDVENEPPTAYNVRRHGPTNRKLFFTPTQKAPSTPSPTYLLTRDSITRRYYKQHENVRTPIKTPLPRRPSNAPSTSRRPKITRLDATPSGNRTLQGSAPDRWRMRQITDLTAWLNHELSANSDAAALPIHQVSTSVVFLNQFAQMNAIYRSKNSHIVLSRLTNEICAGRLNVSKTIKLASFLKERDELISLLLLNYHPHWLLLALSVVLGMNLATELDETIEQAGAGGRSFNYEQVLTQTLENAIRNHFLADAPSDTIASREQASPDGQERDRYNALILRRTLVVIYLLDVAKRQRDPIIKPDPPLFRATSDMTSSVDVLKHLQKLLLNDHGDIVRFLSQRGYSVSYRSPIFEPFGNLGIVNLSEDMRDGTRLCKLASIMRRDHQILTQVIRIGPGHRPAMALALKKQNIALALSSMREGLPPNLQSRFQWNGTPHDIATGNIDKTVAVVWQIAALWMEYVVVDNQKLKEELEMVKDEFRVARRNPDSPSNNVQIDLSALADSPSKLQIIESCDTHSGDLLLMWCATLCGIYGVEIRDFTEDFRDGAVLCLILHHYCPELMRIDEINRIPAGEYRGAFAAEAEHKHVQKNLDLFMDRCRLLGTIPEIFVSAEATLAPAFRDSLKQESVGRVMQLLASYLFRRMMMQKETSSARREVWKIMENHKETPELEESQEVDPLYQRETTPIGKAISIDTAQQEFSEPTAEESSADPEDFGDPAISTQESNSSAPDRLDSESVQGGNNGDLAHVYTRMRHVQSRRATRPRPSQLIADREKAARVILAHYRGHKARQEYIRLRSAIIDLQSSVRGYFARQEVHEIRATHTAHSPQSVPPEESEEAPTLRAMESSRSPTLLATTSSVIPGENTRSLPIRIGQQILEFIPAFRRHILAMESYSERMMDHERLQAENHAATVIQSATRSHLARRTRNDVETQRIQTRRTWMSCAAEAAKAALRIAENQRRELLQWQEQLIKNAIHQAGNKFSAEMLRAETARKQADSQQQKLAQMNAAQEASFTAELHRQKLAFEEQLAVLESDIYALESRDANRESPLASSVDSKQGEEIFETVERLHTADNAQRDAVRLIFEELNAERKRADRFESDLRDIRRSEQEAKEDIHRCSAEWHRRFQSIDADVERWYGTVLNGAICMATAQYRSHMDKLRTVRSKEELERFALEQGLQKGIAAFDEEERQDYLVVSDKLAKLDADTEYLKEAVVAHELWEEQTEKLEARVNQQQAAIEADLDVLNEQLMEKDTSWLSATKEFDTEAEEMQCLVYESERNQQENDRHNDNLDEEIERIIAKEHRNDMQGKLNDILDNAEGKFYEEMSERGEENENNLYCRHEIDILLEQEDQEAVLDVEEFEEDMEKVKNAIEDVEDTRSGLDEHLGLLDSYINQLFSVSPSAMVFEDIPDVFGEELEDGFDECSAIYTQTCQLMEQLCVGESEEEEEEEEEEEHSSLSDNSLLQSSPGSVKNVVIGVSSEHQPSDNGIGEREDEENTDTEVSLTTTTGLYQRLVEGELEYYNGRATHDIGVQTGSGSNCLSSSQVDDLHPEIGTQTSNCEVHSPIEEQSYPGDTSDLSPHDKRASSLPYSHEEDQDSFVYERSLPNDLDGHEESNLPSLYDSLPASPTETNTPDAIKQGLSDRTPVTRDESRDVSLGPLDTLAQLALQDAFETNMYENGFHPTCVQTSENLILSSGTGYTAAANAAEKENVVDTMDESASKDSTLKIYGLHLNSPLHAWNSPIQCQDIEAQKVGNSEYKQTFTQVESAPSTLDGAVVGEVVASTREAEQAFEGDLPDNLGDLYVELNSLDIQPHRESVESLVQNPSSANKLESVMRRISIAASSPQVKSKRRAASPQSRQEPHRDIIRTIFILIRYCSRSENQLKLRELGISIICDFCVIHRRIADIMAAEECIDVLTTCVQYHRDQDTVFDPTVRILWEIALRPDGKQMIVDNKDSVERLQSVYELLVSQVVREQKNRDRIRQANMIVDIVRKRRTEGGSLKSMADALRTARDQKLSSEIPMTDSHRLLGDLVEIIS